MRCGAGARWPGRGRRDSGSAPGNRPWRYAGSKNGCPAGPCFSRCFCRAKTAGASASSMSLTARSVAACSMSEHPSSRLSTTADCTAWSSAWTSVPGPAGGTTPACCSIARSCDATEALRGSRHVTSASDPAREDTMRCAAFRTRAASGSTAKSFSTSSRAVMHAMVTERSTTGETISRTAAVSATGRSLASATRVASGRFGAGAILTCCCIAFGSPPSPPCCCCCCCCCTRALCCCPNAPSAAPRAGLFIVPAGSKGTPMPPPTPIPAAAGAFLSATKSGLLTRSRWRWCSR